MSQLVNIATFLDRALLEEELAMLRAAPEAGADTVMDQSTDGDLDRDPHGHSERVPGSPGDGMHLPGG